MTAEAASADLGLCLLEAARGEDERGGQGTATVSERRGRTRAAPGRRRDEPTTPELESVIGDGDGEKDEGRGATAAERNLAPRPTRDGLAAVAGPSVEAAEAVAFILAVVDEGKIIQNKRREGGSTRLLFCQ